MGNTNLLDSGNERDLLDYLEAEYSINKRSWKDIAEELGTYANKLKRFAKRSGLNVTRSRSEAQKVALATGAREHPTAGKTRSEETKRKIADTVANYWEEMPEEELQERKEQSKEKWDSIPEWKKKEMLSLAAVAVREASKNGSKLENFLNSSLQSAGFRVEFHKTDFVANKKLEMDLFLPDIHTVIEVDGPAHFKPIWGQESLNNHVRADAEKSGLLLDNGYVVLRIKHIRKNVSDKSMRDLSVQVVDELNKIKNKFPSNRKDRMIELEI